MKECAYCGRENEDHAVACRECGTDSFKGDPPKESDSLPELDAQEHLVTLTTCQNLMNAHLLVSRLAAAGIEALIPDEFLMQNVGFSLNTYGYVRVQVRQKDYSQARSILSGSDQDVVGSQQSQIRIVGVPPGEAPESIREQWVGLDLPLAPGFSTAWNTETCGVVSGKTDEKQVIGYVVDIEDAMIVLGRKSPEAVSWWREHATHLFCEGGKLIFDDYVCELIKNDDA